MGANQPMSGGKHLKRYQVVVIGAGPAGISAAIWSHRLNLSTCILEKEAQIGGQLAHIQNPLIDYPGFPFSTGRDLLKSFQNHLQSTKVDLYLSSLVVKVDPNERIVYTRDGAYGYDFLILATGAKDRRLGVPGEEVLLRQTYSASRDRHRFRGKQVCVVGGGDRALEGAWLLAEAGANVLLVHRSDRFRARAEFREKAIGHPNIQVFTHTQVKAFFGDPDIQELELVRYQPQKQNMRVSVDAVFVRIGTQPNNELLQGIVERNADGTCKVNAWFETSVDNLYCIGDAQVHPDYSSIATAVGQGMIAAKRISLRLEEGQCVSI
jgi:thioredoxin reductase (NADPH)